jgi:3-oxoacyl-[acyl-carrier-protein] synthase III
MSLSMPGSLGILAPSYVIGEESLKVDTIENRAAVLQQHNMPDRQALWGWDAYRRTRRSRVELARDTAADTLARSGLAVSAIDALIVCCGDGLSYFQQNEFIAELSGALDLSCDFVTWIGGAGCASLCSAVQIAKSLVLTGTCMNVLIITADKRDDDASRFQRFGVFSDGACSFIVRGCGEIDYTLVGVAVASSLSSLLNGGQNLAEKCQLIQSVFERAGAGTEFPYAGSVYFGSNVFLPVQQLEQSVLPVKGLIAYRHNTARYGHCSAADPFINLIDYYADNENPATKTAVIAISAYGHFGVMLLERRA